MTICAFEQALVDIEAEIAEVTRQLSILSEEEDALLDQYGRIKDCPMLVYDWESQHFMNGLERMKMNSELFRLLARRRCLRKGVIHEGSLRKIKPELGEHELEAIKREQRGCFFLMIMLALFAITIVSCCVGG